MSTSTGDPAYDPAFDLAIAHALVRQASDGLLPEAVRVYRPTTPVVAFGRRETRLPGFPAAAGLAREAGFTPVVRATGGRAVAYTSEAVIVDLVAAEADPTHGHEGRFATLGQSFVDLFLDLGIDARLGPVPGEYCPGAHSVNAHGTVKLVGTAQRIVRGAWLFSALVITSDEDVIRPVLDGVYRALGEDFDPASVGSLGGERGELTTQASYDALVRAYPPTVGVPDGETLKRAETLLADHQIEV